MEIRKRLKTGRPENRFEKDLEVELLSAWKELAECINGGYFEALNLQLDAIADAVSEADAVTKLNTLLQSLRDIGLIKT